MVVVPISGEKAELDLCRRKLFLGEVALALDGVCVCAFSKASSEGAETKSFTIKADALLPDAVFPDKASSCCAWRDSRSEPAKFAFEGLADSFWLCCCGSRGEPIEERVLGADVSSS